MNGYKPNKISTIVDPVQLDVVGIGYKPNKISTIVDVFVKVLKVQGYKPNKISTIVDSCTPAGCPRWAISQTKFLLL